MSWLDDLLGIKRIRDLAGTLLPQRGGLRVAGGLEATDDPSTGETVLTVAEGGVGDIASDRLVGRDTAGIGPAEQIEVVGGLEFTGSGSIRRSALTGDVTASAGSAATTIANAAVTLAKMANIATARIIGRVTVGDGVPEALTASQVKTLLATTLQEAYAATVAAGGEKTIDVGDGTDPVRIGSDAETDAVMRWHRIGDEGDGVAVYFGDSDPNGVVTADAGSIFIRAAYTTSPQLKPTVYINETNSTVWRDVSGPVVLHGSQTLTYAMLGRTIVVVNANDQAPATITPDGAEFNGGVDPILLGPGGVAVFTPYTAAGWRATVNTNSYPLSFAQGVEADLTTGDSKFYYRFPTAFYLQDVCASLSAAYASSSGDVDIMFRKNATDILADPLTIDVGDDTNRASAAPHSFNGTSRFYARDDLIEIDVDAAGTGVRGLQVSLIGYAIDTAADGGA